MIDTKKIEEAVTMILEAIGEDPKREGLVETPARVAKAYTEICGGYEDNAKEHLKKVFTAPNSQMVIVRDIEFYSLCEHHMVPFFGKVNVAYMPGDKVIGLSKIARIVEVFSKRLQLQEQLNKQIAMSIYDQLGCKGVYVTVEARHLCMEMRGVRNNASTISEYKLGEIDELRAMTLLK